MNDTIRRLVLQGYTIKFERYIAPISDDPVRTAEYVAITMTDIKNDNSVTEFVWERASDGRFELALASLEAKLRLKETYP